MIDDIYTIDNVISIAEQNDLEDLFTSQGLAWVFFKDIALSSSEIKKLGITKLTPGIGCYILQDNPKFVNQKLLDKVKIIPERACKVINRECKEIFNVRSFMQFPLVEELRKEYDNPHIDINYEHLVCLYYVNDSDGDTFLFDKIDNELKIKKRITPKKGRVLLFNGNRYHASSGPTNGIRCIINFNVSI